MNDKCKYCDYVSKCSRICEYNSYLCKVHRSFPKVVDKSYEQLQQENKQLKMINKEYERLNKEKNRGFKITNVQEYNIDKLLSCKKYKDNWNRLKEWIKVRDNIGFEKISLEDIVYEMVKLEQGSDNNE